MKTVRDGAFYRKKNAEKLESSKTERICTNLRTGTLNDMQTIIKISVRPSKTGRIDKLLLFFYAERAEVFFNGQNENIIFWSKFSHNSP